MSSFFLKKNEKILSVFIYTTIFVLFISWFPFRFQAGLQNLKFIHLGL